MKNWKIRNDVETEMSDESKVFSIERQSIDVNPPSNKIYFYSDVTRDTILSLIRQIDESTKQSKLTQLTYDLDVPPPIQIHICSDGGDILGSMAAVDKIINNSVPVYTYCEGIVASAATLLSVVGHKRYISPNSCMLIHQVKSGLWGNYVQFKDEIKNLELLMYLIKGVYIKNTKFNENELEDILSHDLFLNAQQCLSHGLVDAIV